MSLGRDWKTLLKFSNEIKLLKITQEFSVSKFLIKTERLTDRQTQVETDRQRQTDRQTQTEKIRECC